MADSSFTWRILIVDDREADAVEEFISGERVFQAPDAVHIEKCTDFGDALRKIESLRLDIVILDLKDDSITLDDAESPFAGEKILQQIRERRFIPVVFHTAWANKITHLTNPFVRVVNRAEPRDLRSAIQEIFATGLPYLLRHLESAQREYMWDHVQTQWLEFKNVHEQIDLTYLLARRLANTLGRDSVRQFLAQLPIMDGQKVQNTDAHPMEMYVYPPSHPTILAGDVIEGSFSAGRSDDESDKQYWIVITPSCDLEQGKAERILLAKCLLLTDQQEYTKVYQGIAESSEVSKTAERELRDLLQDNRSRKGTQRERYRFLPATFFLPNLVADFQSLVQVTLEEVASANRIASLDSPFAEAFLASFARYYSRLGTPGIDSDAMYGRILSSIRADQLQTG